MTRILLIISYHPERSSDIENRERLTNTYPNLVDFEFAYIGIKPLNNPLWDFYRRLVLLTTEFKPDYIMIHTGTGLRDNPSLVVNSLLKISKKYPNIKVGFQGGHIRVLQEIAIGEIFHRGADNHKVVSAIETDKIFQETDDVIELTKKIFFPHI